MEPTTIVAKAWEQIDRVLQRARRSGPSACSSPAPARSGCSRRCSRTQRGYDVHVLDRATDGPKPELVRDLGGTYHATPVTDVDPPPDIIVEATGASQVVLDAMAHTARERHRLPHRHLLGRARDQRSTPATLNRTIVLENDLVFGSVNANRRHYEAAARRARRAPTAAGSSA